MKTKFRSFRDGVAQFLTPQVWKQAHQVRSETASRWTLQPLVWTLLAMALCLGGSEGERYATARAYCVACRPKQRRPGKSLQGFQEALAHLPMPVLRALAAGLRERLGESFLDGAHRRLCAVGVRRHPPGMSARQGTATAAGGIGQAGYGPHDLLVGSGAVAPGAAVVVVVG